MLDSRLIAFAGLAFVLVLTPGANIMLVVRSVLDRGPKAGIATALGIGAGHFVHASASALGLSVFLRSSALAFTAVKVAGAAYLAYLGVRSLVTAWRGKSATFDVVEGEAVESGPQRPADAPRSRRAFVDGLLCNLLNPKVALFYLALLPQFIEPGDPVLGMALLLAGVHATISISWQSLLSVALGKLRPVLTRPAVGRVLESLTGVLLLGFGVRLALAHM